MIERLKKSFNTVGTNIADVSTVAGVAGNVNTVAGIAPNVTTVAGVSANVTTVAGISANVTTVAGVAANVTTVAGISADVTAVATVASDIPTVAANVSSINDYADTYQGAKATAPTLRNNGSALQVGDLYFNSTSNAMFVRASTGWVPAGSSVNGTSQRYRYIATAGQTTFTGTDSNGNTLTYDAGFVDIYLNGVRLDSTDFTASSGTSIVLASGAALNDELNIVAFGTFNVAAFNGSGLIDGTTNISKLNATGTRSSSTFLAGDNTFKTVAVTPTAVSDQTNSSTGYFDLPAGTTAERPVSPPTGATRYNTSTGSIEFYNSTTWVSTNLIPVVNSVTGTIYAGAASTLTLSVSNTTDTITVRFSEGGSTVADVASVAVTAGSASVSVPAAVYGQTAGDTIAVSVINADGTPSSNSVNKTVSALPTGGTITTTGSYRVHTFTSSSSFVQNAQTASYVQNAISSSFALTASFVQNAQTASYVQNAQTASYVQNAQTASFVVSASYAQTASFVQNAISSSFASTASFVQNAQTASYVQNAQTASFVQNRKNFKISCRNKSDLCDPCI